MIGAAIGAAMQLVALVKRVVFESDAQSAESVAVLAPSHFLSYLESPVTCCIPF